MMALSSGSVLSRARLKSRVREISPENVLSAASRLPTIKLLPLSVVNVPVGVEFSAIACNSPPT